MNKSLSAASKLSWLAAIALIVAAACGSTQSTPLPSASAAATPTATPVASPTAARTAGPSGVYPSNLTVYNTIETQVEQLRQLAPKAAVTPVLLDEQGVRDYMTKAAATQMNHAVLAAQSRLYIHLGLLPAGASLEQLEIDLNSSQAIGFYDPTTKGLYLLSSGGTVGPEQKLTFSHEFTHALQDQNFGLDKLATDTPDQSDRDLARTALPEGDATLSMTQWAQSYMTLQDLLSVSLSAASGPQQEQLNNAPAILREQLMFPYIQGLAFVQSVYQSGGWAAVDKLYSNPPNSTSQILHPDLYKTGVQPVAVTVPAGPDAGGPGWKAALLDTMGELGLRVWLAGEHPAASQESAAEAAVATWAGDRIGLYEGPNGAWVVVMRTAWRTAAGRDAFAAALNKKLAVMTSPSTVCGGSTDVDIYIASDQTYLAQFATCKQGE